MIIECNNCNKKFTVDNELIPINGRLLECSACNHKWFYKPINDSEDSITEIDIKDEKTSDITETKTEEQFNDELIEEVEDTTEIIKKSKNGSNSNILTKFISYLVVFLISLIALLILVDTFKIPLIQIFPNLELILFNLFEVFTDINLFIKDLF